MSLNIKRLQEKVDYESSGGSASESGMKIVKMNENPITLTTAKTQMDLSDAKLIIIEIIHSFGFTVNSVVLPNQRRCMVDFYNYKSSSMAYLEIKTESDGISLFNSTSVANLTQNIYKVY